jgi:hypothetical protein
MAQLPHDRHLGSQLPAQPAGGRIKQADDHRAGRHVFFPSVPGRCARLAAIALIWIKASPESPTQP